MIIWNNHWEWELESVWGLLNKLEFANQINDHELLSELKLSISSSIIQDIKTYNLGAFKVNYNAIKDAINIDMIEKQKSSITYILKPFNLDSFFMSSDTWYKYKSERWFNKYLCYCPECMKLGYHSLYHQFIFNNNECFIHKVQLEKYCPNCGNTIPYGISSKPSCAPYSCQCGYKLFDMTFEDAYNIWLKPLQVYSKIKVYSVLPSMAIIKPTSQYLSGLINDGLFKTVSNICFKNSYKGNSTFKVQKNSKVSPCYIVDDDYSEKSHTDIDLIYWKAIQAAERHIRRSMKLKKVKAIHNLLCNRIDISNYNTETIAYFLLVKYSEGVTSLNLVHSLYMQQRRQHSYVGWWNDWGPKHIFNELAHLDNLYSRYSKEMKLFIYHNIIYRLFILRLLQTFNLIHEQVKKDYKEIQHLNINEYYNNFRKDIEDPTSYILELNYDYGHLWCVPEKI